MVLLLEIERVVTPQVDEGQSQSRMRNKWLERVLQVADQKYVSGVKGKVVLQTDGYAINEGVSHRGKAVAAGDKLSGERIWQLSPSTFWGDPTWAFLVVGTEQLQVSCRFASHLSFAKLLSRQVIVAVKLLC